MRPHDFRKEEVIRPNDLVLQKVRRLAKGPQTAVRKQRAKIYRDMIPKLNKLLDAAKW